MYVCPVSVCVASRRPDSVCGWLDDMQQFPLSTGGEGRGKAYQLVLRRFSLGQPDSYVYIKKYNNKLYLLPPLCADTHIDYIYMCSVTFTVTVSGALSYCSV